MTARSIFARFTRTASVMDLRPDHMTRRARCERFARRNKTCGKRARFSAAPDPDTTAVQRFWAGSDIYRSAATIIPNCHVGEWVQFFGREKRPGTSP